MTRAAGRGSGVKRSAIVTSGAVSAPPRWCDERAWVGSRWWVGRWSGSFFGPVQAQHLLEDPDVVIQGNRVLHLRYPVRR